MPGPENQSHRPRNCRSIDRVRDSSAGRWRRTAPAITRAAYPGDPGPTERHHETTDGMRQASAPTYE
ncbi:hypothetical protein GCM10010495_17710 [Kitasatospora herbaricolor]|nr:hypothetical protein GCM10010495_17710 [Kitasatospora herbaricolor]